MASAMTPIIGAYWQESGDRTLGRIAARTGLDPGPWEVKSPHLADKVKHASYRFCAGTNATTSLALGDALAKLREEFHAGLVTSGDSIPELTRRVKAIFDTASTSRARRIAITEASSAVHAAQLESARESGVVVGKELLLSGDACPLCREIASRCRIMRLDTPFAVVGTNADYASKQCPPLHPGCRCSMLEVLSHMYGGPEDPDYGQTLIQPSAAVRQKPEAD